MCGMGLWEHIRATMTRLRLDERVILIPLLILAAGVWAFVEIADEVIEGDTITFDEAAIRVMRSPDNLADPVGPPWLEEIGRDLTALGGVAVMTLTILLVCSFLFLQRKRRTAWFVLFASGGGFAISMLLKEFFHRDRPQLVPHLSAVYTSSFPSGHSMLSAAVYITLGALLARTVTDPATRVFCVAVGVLLTVLVGISRVYLGVHYPTDVLAGWAAGMSWAVLCWLVAAYLQKRGAVEAPEDWGQQNDPGI